MLWNLFDCRDDETLQQALKNIPDSLEDLYADVLANKIPKGYAQKARLMLMWLSYSLRPLTIKELACVACLPDPQDVLWICTSYLVCPQHDDRSPQLDGQPYNVGDRVVQFDHFSVKEYLTSDHLLATEGTAYFHVSPHEAHLTIAEMLVSHVINTNHVDFFRKKESGATLGDDFIKEDPLLTYSTIWYKHTLQADALGTSSPESKALTSKTRPAEAQPDLELLRTKAHRLFCGEFLQSLWNWYYLLRIGIEDSTEPGTLRGIYVTPASNPPIKLASLLDMVDNVQRLLSDGVHIDGDVRSHGRWAKPVVAAAMSGGVKVLRLLLERGASFDQSDLDMVARYNSRRGADVLISILKSRQDLAITDDTVEGIASNDCSPEMLDYVLGTKDVVTLTPSMFMTLIKSHWTMMSNDVLMEKLLSRFLVMIRHSKTILITETVMSRLAINKEYGRVIFSLLIDHRNCKVNDFQGLKDFQIVSGVETHIRTCPVQISKERIKATAHWEPAAIRYLQDHARPNVTFAKTLADAEPSNSNV